MAGVETMDSNGGSEAVDARPDSTAVQHHHTPSPDDSQKRRRKRRKVNQACVYCRRSHMTCDLDRPCGRCKKRDIGHLCHDEPRDGDAKRTRSGHGEHDAESQPDVRRGSMDQAANQLGRSFFDGSTSVGPGQAAMTSLDAGALGQSTPLQRGQPTPVSEIQGNTSSSELKQYSDFSDAWITAQNHYRDLYNYHPNYMIAPEVTNEFDLLNQFLQNSLFDDGVAPGDEQAQAHAQAQAQAPVLGVDLSDAAARFGSDDSSRAVPPPSAIPPAGSMPPPKPQQGRAALQPPPGAVPTDRDTDRYYLQAADPSGNDTSEKRMQRLLATKAEFGLLKPFNYIKGYTRLSNYLDGHVALSSKTKILNELSRFRPKFREKMEKLDDMDLIYVEMWFEKTLMEYDRVFASMAVPACCWRRTGEIFKGNKEMAELIHVPVEKLRGGQISLHEILTEESVVRYWEEFGTIAFDVNHDTLITSCALKSPDDKSDHPVLHCCFSFAIRRDHHTIPSLIVGNFLPNDP